MARTRRKAVMIAEPEFPAGMPAEPVESIILADQSQLGTQFWQGVDLSNQRADDVLLEYIRSRQSLFQAIELPLLQCNDSVFEGDDFASAVFGKPYLRRVRFAVCRMIGCSISDGDLQDITFERCRLDMARIWTTRVSSTIFDHCSMREASFDGADLSGVIFRNCDLTGADFRNARLQGADLRGSTIEHLTIGPADLAGAIVDPQQAVELITLFGVVVRTTES